MATEEPFDNGKGVPGDEPNQPHQDGSQTQIIKLIRGDVIGEVSDDLRSGVQVEQIPHAHQSEERQRHEPASLTIESRQQDGGVELDQRRHGQRRSHEPGAVVHHAEKGEQHKREHQTIEMAADPEFDDHQWMPGIEHDVAPR